MHHSTYTTACARAGVVYLLCKKDTTVGERNVYNKIHNIRAFESNGLFFLPLFIIM